MNKSFRQPIQMVKSWNYWQQQISMICSKMADQSWKHAKGRLGPSYVQRQQKRPYSYFPKQRDRAFLWLKYMKDEQMNPAHSKMKIVKAANKLCWTFWRTLLNTM